MIYDAWDLDASNDTTYSDDRCVKDMLRHDLDFGQYGAVWETTNIHIEYYNALEGV